MQMQAMNHQYGNRGFGGPPQPQRQGGRRGNRGGGGQGFQGRKNNRFEPNQRNQNQGGQRPNNAQVDGPGNKPPAQQQPQNPQGQPQQQQRPQGQQQPNQQQQRPQGQQAGPQGQQAAQKPTQQPQQKPAIQQAKPAQPAQPAQPAKPAQQAQPAQAAQTTPKKPADTQDKNADVIVIPDQKNIPKQQSNQPPQQQQQRNINGNFGGNRQSGGWQQAKQGGGPPGRRQTTGGFNNQGNQGMPFGQGNQGGQGNQSGQGNQGGQGSPVQSGQGGQGGQGPQGGQGGPGGQGRNQRSYQRGQFNNEGKPMREEHMLANKLKDLGGPITELQPLDLTEVKYNGRSRLYIGNLWQDCSEDEILKLFSQYGETAELFINKEKNFGFIKLDFRANAEKAKRELDGYNKNGRQLRVRFAPHNSAIHVKNLATFVSNELLYRAFEIFGKIERAFVKVDERGKTLGEGIVEYSRKPSALAAIRNCTEKCFFLTSSLRPVIVEALEEPDEFDGYPEKNLPKKHPEFLRSREVGPRFADSGSFEHEYGTRWKQLYELHKQKEEALKKELAAEEEKLEAQMEYAKYEHETEMLREQLRQREQDRERQKRTYEAASQRADTRMENERVENQRQETQLAERMRHQDDELRRRQQENTLFVQAQRLNSMLDRQEQGMFNQQPMEGGFRDQFDRQRGGYDDMPQGRGWDGPRPMDDFPNKRRRF